VGDHLSESFADKLDEAFNVLMFVALIAETVGFFTGFTPLLVGRWDRLCRHGRAAGLWAARKHCS
jgi:hypothetical protein